MLTIERLEVDLIAQKLLVLLSVVGKFVVTLCITPPAIAVILLLFYCRLFSYLLFYIIDPQRIRKPRVQKRPLGQEPVF